MPVLQIGLTEPLEVAVLGHYLHEVLELGVAGAVVAGLVGVGDHEHVPGLRVPAQAGKQFGQ